MVSDAELKDCVARMHLAAASLDPRTAHMHICMQATPCVARVLLKDGEPGPSAYPLPTRCLRSAYAHR